MSTDESMRLALQRLIDQVRAGQYDQAIEGLKRFLEQYPQHEVAMGLLGAAYFQIGLPARARECYEQVLELNPQNALARFQMGMLQFSQAELQAALATWAPLLSDSHDFMAHFHSALACLELGDTARASALVEGAARSMPVGHPLFAQLESIRERLSRQSMPSRGSIQ